MCLPELDDGECFLIPLHNSEGQPNFKSHLFPCANHCSWIGWRVYKALCTVKKKISIKLLFGIIYVIKNPEQLKKQTNGGTIFYSSQLRSSIQQSTTVCSNAIICVCVLSCTWSCLQTFENLALPSFWTGQMVSCCFNYLRACSKARMKTVSCAT